MLEIHDLQKSFGDLHVLRGIDLNIQKGDVVAVLGSSGSGKTTLLRCMNFLEHADAGTMVFDGQQVELSRITHAQIHALRRRTGFVFQNYNLFAIAGVSINLSGLAIAAIAGILLNALLPGNDYQFDEGSNEPESASLRV